MASTPSRLRKIEQRTWFATLAALLMLGPAGVVQAEANPYYIGAAQSFTRDSNLLRAADDRTAQALGIKSRSDTVSTTSVFAGIDQAFGRQRLSTNATFRKSSYSDNTIYDNTGHGINARLDWSTVERLSGSLSASSNERLASFTTLDAFRTIKRNVQTTDQLSANVRVGVVTRMALEGTISHLKQDFSAEETARSRFNQNGVEFGGRYQSSAQLSIGSGFSFARGRYPATADRYTRRNVYLTATLAATGLSTITGRVNLGRTKRSSATRRNFSGATGSLVWNWRPTGKVSLNTRLSREERENAFISGNDDDTLGENTRLANTVSVNAKYRLTAKTAMDAGLSQTRRSITNSLIGTGNDRSRAISLRLSYSPHRSLSLSCQARRASRNSSDRQISQPFSANVSGCSAKLTLGR